MSGNHNSLDGITVLVLLNFVAFHFNRSSNHSWITNEKMNNVMPTYIIWRRFSYVNFYIAISTNIVNWLACIDDIIYVSDLGLIKVGAEKNKEHKFSHFFEIVTCDQWFLHKKTSEIKLGLSKISHQIIWVRICYVGIQLQSLQSSRTQVYHQC